MFANLVNSIKICVYTKTVFFFILKNHEKIVMIFHSNHCQQIACKNCNKLICFIIATCAKFLIGNLLIINWLSFDYRFIIIRHGMTVKHFLSDSIHQSEIPTRSILVFLILNILSTTNMRWWSFYCKWLLIKTLSKYTGSVMSDLLCFFHYIYLFQ